jgi:SAM-dependent methyltransferase
MIAQVTECDLNQHLPDIETSFQYVLCGDVLEHLVDPLSTLRWVRQRLEPGGHLIASLPNSANIYFRANVLLGRFPDHDKGLFDRTHLHYYAWSNWRTLLKKAGFGVLSVASTSIPFGVAWPKMAGSSLVVTLEALSYTLARGWKTLWAYQFVVVAEPEEPLAGA